MALVKFNQRSVSVIALSAITLALFLASETRGERLPIKSYSLADGMPHGQIPSIMQDSQGFIWFCTWNGITRFDGYGFTNYGTKDGLSQFGINDLKETRSGTYWIATNGDGVCRFNPRREEHSSVQSGSHSRFTVYPVGDEAATNRVNAIYEDREGRLWAGTDGGLFVFDEGKNGFVRVALGIEEQQDRSVQVWAFVQDYEGSIWIGRTAGLTRRLPDGRLLNYSVQFDEAANQVLALLEDPDQRLWIGTRRGLVVLKPDPLSNIEPRKLPWRRLIRGAIGPSGFQPLPDHHADACLYTAIDRPGRDYVRALHRTADGHIWIGVIDGGLVEFDGRGFRRYTTANGLTDDNIRSVFEDRDGNLWLGSVSSGVMKLTRNGFITYDTMDGLGHIIISSVFENQAGDFYATSGDWRINRLDGDRFKSARVNLPPRIPDSEWRTFCSVIQDHTGEWWVATIEGLFRFPRVSGIEHLAKAEPIAHYTKKDGLAEDYIGNLFEDSHGDIWISTFAASKDVLTRWDRTSGKFYRYSESDGLLPLNAARCFFEDASKNLWIGFRNGGVARYHEGRFHLYTARDGLPGGTVNDFLLDHVGRLWITINPGGLFRVDDPSAEEVRFVGWRTGGEFSGSYPSFMAEDFQGRLYITMPRGVDRLDPTTGQTTRYTFADGLPIGRTHKAYCDRRGVLWFSTEKGLLRLVPQPDRPAEPPLPFISGLRIAGEPYPVSDFGQTYLGELELGPNQNQIQIDFFALSLAAGESLRYQYRIEGAGQDWSPPISERSVNVSLSPGSYRFLVRAINADETVSQTPAIVSLRILRPIWQRWWFVTISVLLVGLAGYSAYRYRVARLIELERVRTRIATDLHDDIGASLSQVAVATEVLRRQIGPADPRIAQNLTLIARVSREVVDSMSDIVWAINPHKDNLHDLARRMRRFAGETLAARDIEIHFHAPESEHDIKLGADVRRQVFLVFKESINNVLRHADCTEARIDLIVDGSWLAMGVRDNGKGIKAGQTFDGHGLASMKLRAESLGGSLEISSPPGLGTTVTLRIPHRPHAWTHISTRRSDHKTHLD